MTMVATRSWASSAMAWATPWSSTTSPAITALDDVFDVVGVRTLDDVSAGTVAHRCDGGAR